jgi:hypothetical protein
MNIEGSNMTSKEKVLARYPDARAEYVNCGMGSSYWLVIHGNTELGRAYCGAMSDTRVWDDAASRLPSSAEQPAATKQVGAFSDSERGKAWQELLVQFGVIPIPSEVVWKVQAALTRAINRAEAAEAALAELRATREKEQA